MKISFIDKFGETVWIENEYDFKNMVEKYIGGSALYYIDEFLRFDDLADLDKEIAKMECERDYIEGEARDEGYNEGYEDCKRDIIKFLNYK